MLRCRLALMLMFVAVGRSSSADPPSGAPPADSWESAARKLQQATVTVRIWGVAAEKSSDSAAAARAVTVCSGLCIGKGRVITAALAGSDAPIRLTLPGGKQADAKVQVIDEYSGLALLKAETASLQPLATAEAAPIVGSELVTAAAWGVDQPLVSRGIVGGVDRKYPGTNYPPLVQCDCLTATTSAGAGLVDRAGRLVGVIVATDRGAERRGWAYAVGVAHVERIVRVADEQQGEGVVVLKRRRPIVGMVLDQIGDAVIVERVTAGGPAEKAGIKPGDEIVATDGVAIRSVYQAVLPTIYKQPGDTAAFRFHREGMVHDVTVTLGGGVDLGFAPSQLLADLVQPKVRLARDADGAIVTSRGNKPDSAAVAVLPPLPDDAPPAAAPSAADKIALLEKAISRYQAVIELQQKQLADEQKSRQEQERLLQSLKSEMEMLRKAINK